MDSPQRVGPRPPRMAAILGFALCLGAALTAIAVQDRNSEATEHGIPSPERIAAPMQPLAALLSETGLYLPGGTATVDPNNVAYEPAYPLWTDGATKRRFLRLPEGTAIDASNPDRWVFPVGTRLWKEFSFEGRPVETRSIERLSDGSFRYAAYVWNAAGTDADLASERGVRGVASTRGSARHDVPAQADCRACHEGRSNTVLGLGALQLAGELEELVRRGLVRNLPDHLLEHKPRIAASSENERQALGYLFGNCAHCHNADGPLAALGLDFDQSVLSTEAEGRLRTQGIDQPSRFRLADSNASLRVARGKPAQSIALLRMRSRDAALQMPPLGTHLVDPDGVRSVERWIAEL